MTTTDTYLDQLIHPLDLEDADLETYEEDMEGDNLDFFGDYEPPW